MAGIRNEVLYAQNVDFSGATIPAATVLADGQLLIGSAVAPNIRVGTLTAGTGITVTNGAGAITIASTAAATDLHVAKWIVNATPNAGGNQTTIQAAINAAVSGEDIFIMPGTYTENLTLKAGVNLTSFPCDGYRDLTAATNNVTIVGKMTMTTAGTVVVANVKLQTNSDNILAVTGTAASIVQLNNCFLSCTNATGIVASSTLSEVRLVHCAGSLTTTGIAFFALSGGGNLEIDGGFYNNPGLSITANTWSAGVLTIRNCEFGHILTSSGTGAIGGAIYNVYFNLGTNQTAFTHGNSNGTQISIWNCYIASGSSSAINISNASASLWTADCIIDSSNTNAITGIGSLEYGNILFSNTSSGINVTTQTFDYTQLGKYRAQGQPAFLAYLASSVNDVTGDGTGFTLGTGTALTKVFDQNSNFNTNGTFTAPVTGTYFLGTNFLLQQMAAGTNGTNNQIVTSNATYAIGNDQNCFSGNNAYSYNQYADMDAGDTATINIVATGGTKIVDVFGDRRTNFYGWLAS